jgi:hypothetical protein
MDRESVKETEDPMARAKKRPALTYEEFVFHIRAPSLSYSFSIQHDRRRREWQPFEERQSIHFVTECIWPDRFKGREGKATLWPEPALVDHKLLGDDDVWRKWIGYVRATKTVFETAIWLPPLVCLRLGEAMASGLVRSMLTNGLIETRGMNRVTSASFYGQEFDPVEYVG